MPRAEDAGMAHFSHLSPDRKWTLLAEMDTSSWLPCRLTPFDGSSPGKPVGPMPAQCTDAAWSPYGKWMYFTANAEYTESIHRSKSLCRHSATLSHQACGGNGELSHLECGTNAANNVLSPKSLTVAPVVMEDQVERPGKLDRWSSGPAQETKTHREGPLLDLPLLDPILCEALHQVWRRDALTWPGKAVGL
jgi:hypothetical protein